MSRRRLFAVAPFALATLASCTDELVPETCPDDVPTVVTATASACVVAVIETGFLCSGAWPYRYEYDGTVICADSPELSDEDLRAIMASQWSGRPEPGGPSLSAPNGDAFAGVGVPDAGDRPGVPDANVHAAGDADSGRADEPSTTDEVAEERANHRRDYGRGDEEGDEEGDDGRGRSVVEATPARGAGPPGHASASDGAPGRWRPPGSAAQTPE